MNSTPSTHPASLKDTTAMAAQIQRLAELIHGNWTTLAIKAAIELGVFDALGQGRADVQTLSATLGVQADPLARLLQALVTLDLCAAEPDKHFVLTSMGGLLVDAAPGSLQPWARFWAGPTAELWGDLSESVRHGKSARQLRQGTVGFEHLEHDAQRAKGFNAAMSSISYWVARSFASSVDLASARRMVDVGGGHGELLAHALKSNARLQGTLFDLPHAAAGATVHLASHHLAVRVEVVSGDFFASVPGGADVYVLKSVLHNWADAPALKILRNCRAVMAPASRLFIVERMLPDAVAPAVADREMVRSDLNMMVALNARERTATRYQEMLGTAGFAFTAVTPLTMQYCAMEAHAV